MDTVLYLLALGYLNEQQPRLGIRPYDHALLVPRLVRISRHVVIAKHLLPERGQGEGVAAIERRVRDPRSHGLMVSTSADGISGSMYLVGGI
jgi:hypothetical protein